MLIEPEHYVLLVLAGTGFAVAQALRLAWALGKIEQGQHEPPAGLAAG